MSRSVAIVYEWLHSCFSLLPLRMSYNYWQSRTFDYVRLLSYSYTMSSTLEIVKKNPEVYLPMGTTGPYPDASGFEHDGAGIATSRLGISLAYGVLNSTVLDNTTYMSFPSSIFYAGQENVAFTLIAAFRAVKGTTTGPVQVLGNGNLDTGLTIDGTVISFTVEYTGSVKVSASYDIQVPRKVHAAAIYSTDKISLFIDGEPVAETAIPEANRSLSFLSTDDELFCGRTSTDQSLMVNGIGYFAKAMAGSEIKSMYQATYIPDKTDKAYQEYDGHPYKISQNSLNIFSTQIIQTDADWNWGYKEDVVVKGDRLLPTLNTDDTSIYGYWEGNFPLATDDPIYGININWDGIGVTVEVSTDYTTWEEVYQGKNIELITPGFLPADETLFVKIGFDGEILNDPSYVESLTITGFTLNTADYTSAQEANDREIRWDGAFLDIRTEQPANKLSDDWGTLLFSEGELVIKDGGVTGIGQPKTVEVWVRPEGSDYDESANLVPVGGDVYINGLTTGTLQPDEWCVVHYTSPTEITGDIIFGGNVQIGRVVYYEQELTSDEVYSLYKSYVGANLLTVQDISILTITEPASSSNLYAHDWSILASG